MHISKWILIGLIFGLAGCCCPPKSRVGEWTVLFDGSDLDQWVVVEGGDWSLENGVLVGRNGRNWTTNPENTGSWLRSTKSYADFELELDYAISPGGNSGVMFRSAADKNPSFTGYELQITDCHGKQLNEHNSGIYAVAGARRDVFNPGGEWNHARIRVVGHQITIQVNGETIVEHTGDRRLEGYVGLQNHDERAVVRFRNLRIREL